MVSTTDAAAELHYTTQTVRNMIERNELKATRYGKNYDIDRGSLDVAVALRRCEPGYEAGEWADPTSLRNVLAKLRTEPPAPVRVAHEVPQATLVVQGFN